MTTQKYDRTLRYLQTVQVQLERDPSSLTHEDVERLKRLYEGSKNRDAAVVESVESEIVIGESAEKACKKRAEPILAEAPLGAGDKSDASSDRYECETNEDFVQIPESEPLELAKEAAPERARSAAMPPAPKMAAPAPTVSLSGAGALRDWNSDFFGSADSDDLASFVGDRYVGTYAESGTVERLAEIEVISATIIARMQHLYAGNQ